jgi:hypothetical protein
MAQTKKKRRRKRRGTQGGRIDTKARRSRPRTREEAKARARSGRAKSGAPKADLPPTWRSSLTRGLFAAVIFAVLLIAIFKKPIGVSLAFGAFMLIFYVPAGYYIDSTLWRKRERTRIREREER